MSTATRPLRDDTRMSVGRWLLLTSGACSLAVAGVQVDPASQVRWQSIAFFFVVLAMAHWVTKPGVGFPEFAFAPWLLAVASVAYGLATVTFFDSALPELHRNLVSPALLLSALGLGMFAAGARLTTPGRTSLPARLLDLPMVRGRDIPRARLALVGVYFVGLAATAAQAIVLGDYGYLGGSDIDANTQVAGSTQLFVLLTGLRNAALYAMTLRHTKDRTPGSLLVLAVVVALEIALGLISGIKESFVLTLVAVLIPIAAARGRLPWKSLVAAAAVFVLFVTPFVTDLRDNVRGGGARLGVDDSVSVALDKLRDPHFGEIEANTRQVASRVRLIDNTVVIIQKTPSVIEYRPLVELATSPASALIPRAAWPDKPLRISGLQFYKEYYNGLGESSSAVTFQGSLYMYGGTVVVLVGMLLFGLLIGAVDAARRLAGSARGGLLGLIAFEAVIKQEMDSATLLASIPIFLVTYYIHSVAIFAQDTTNGNCV